MTFDPNALLKAHTRTQLDETCPPGMYLTLHHGRNAPGEGMEERGFDGPVIGPLTFCHITYSCTISLGFTDGDETGPLMGKEDLLAFHDDMLRHDGKFYGDWELQVWPRQPA